MLLVLFDKEEEQKRSQCTNPRHPRERLKEKTRERSNQKTSGQYTITVPVMVTVLVLLCSEENFAGTTPPLSPEPTAWFRVCCCSLPPPVPPPEVFIVVLLFSFNEPTERRKKNGDKKSSLGFIRYPKYTWCITHSSLFWLLFSSFFPRLVVVVTI